MTVDWHFLFMRFDGRLARQPFWFAILALTLLFILLTAITGFLPFLAQQFILGIAYTLLIYPMAALMAKRLHDRGKDNHWLWLFLGLPVAIGIVSLVLQLNPQNIAAIILSAIYFPVALWAFIELGLLRGADGPNMFGPDPLAGE